MSDAALVGKQYYHNNAATIQFSRPFEQGLMWDRNEIITPNTSMRLLTPLGVVVQPANIYDICMARASELALLVKNNDKKLYVFWSGGIDSTLVLLCLREVLPTNKIVVLYTAGSLVEYPGFFEQHIQGTFETFEFTMNAVWKAVELACANGIAITGEIGDQIFGSVLYLHKDQEWLTQPWENFNSSITADEAYHRLVAACPQKITDVAEFLWWINYSMKYQLVQCRMLLDNQISKLNDNIYHFFDSKGFNDYAVSTHIETKMPGYSLDTYKKPLRDVIYALSNDAIYAYTKPKVRSLVPIYGKFSFSKVAKTINLDWVRGYR